LNLADFEGRRQAYDVLRVESGDTNRIREGRNCSSQIRSEHVSHAHALRTYIRRDFNLRLGILFIFMYLYEPSIVNLFIYFIFSDHCLLLNSAPDLSRLCAKSVNSNSHPTSNYLH
jgi:hypothetical protein